MKRDNSNSVRVQFLEIDKIKLKIVDRDIYRVVSNVNYFFVYSA